MKPHCIAFTIAISLLPVAISTRAALALEAKATIQGDEDAGTISRHIYGHFAEHLGRCIYDGIWVGEDSEIPNTRGIRNDIVAALREISIPNLRWPGGCFADDYHWRDGIGPRDKRPKRFNMHWGQVVESNAFGTHEFLDLCEQLNCEPYLAGNVGSGTPQEMRDWIEYLTYDGDSELADLRRANGRDKPWKIKYFGVGNENWGCGGNMRPEYYADLFRRFATFCPDLSGNRLIRVACGPGGFDQNWSRVVVERAADRMQAYSIHYYTVWPGWNNKTPATDFGEAEWFAMLRGCLEVRRAIRESAEVLDRRDRRKRIPIYVDEWGSWYRTEPGHPGYGLYQQNSLRDAILAGLTFHIFHEHNDRVKMANIAQIVNVLQSMILTKDAKMLLTPTYHVFQMYKVHHDAERLSVQFESPDYEFEGRSMPAMSISASRNRQGDVHISIVNAHAHDAVDLTCELPGIDAVAVAGRVLTSDKLDAHNTFEDPEHIRPGDFQGASIKDGKLAAAIPARSVVVLHLSD
jgi:alpha-N-arabinofuranosidase